MYIYLYNYRYIIYGKQIKTNHNYPPIVSGASSGKIRKNLHENSHLIEILQGGKTPRGVFPIKSRAIAFFGCKKSSVRRGIPQKLPYRDFPPPQMGNLMTPCIFVHQTCCIAGFPQAFQVTMSHWANRFIIRSPSFHDVSSSSLATGKTTADSIII